MLKTLKGLAAAGVVAASVIAMPASADVTVGTADASNGFPLTAPYDGTYQQVYGHSAFSAPTTINTVQFYVDSSQPPSTNSNSYTLSFYLTNSAVDGLSTNPTVNETTLLSSFGTFVPGNSYVFTGSSFTYDPSLGNLLLNISTSSASLSITGFLLSATSATDQTSRLYRSFGNSTLTTDTAGLVTTFSLTGGVPEPSTWAMMLIGFGGIGVALRRRATPKAARLNHLPARWAAS